MDNLDYSQQRSLNVGVAIQTSIEAALIYDDLVYAQKTFGRGYFYRSDEMMLNRLPFLTKSTMRRHVDKLIEQGYLSTKIEKVGGSPVRHYQIEQILLPKMNKTKDLVKMTKTSNSKETIKETKNSVGVDELLLSLISLVNPKEKGTADRRRALNARLKDYKPEEITNAAIAFSRSEWHIENKQMSIDNLLAPSKFGRWFTKGQELTPGETVTAENQDEMVRRRRAGK